ncbi:MAG: DNA primase [Tepidisphaera sp.]|nr:DNA primase [Tepidisphaera sp.]
MLWSPHKDNGDKERVRDASDIVRIVGESVALRPKGREYAGLCPFHDDHRPSMNVIPSKQIFHCFVCGASGDVFTFVQKFHKMDFREALEYLAERAGIALTPLRGAADAGAPSGPSRKSLLEANTQALRFFRGLLAHAEHGKVGRELIARRGISPEMVEAFQLGLAPDRWDGLQLWARQNRLDEASLLAAGLLKRREGSDGCYDALRHRLIFPIHNKAGQVIAFGGRKIRDEDEPKYLNSPETPLFNKSATLYALHLASNKIQLERTAIICEGYTDVIACHQAGFTNAIATLGTALTREHAKELRLRCDKVVLLFDGDEAGQRAADRAVPIFFAEQIDVCIATLNKFTDAKDPDELLKRPGGGEVFRQALAAAQDLIEYRLGRVRARLAGAGLSALEKGITQEIADFAAMGLATAAPQRRELIERRLAEISGLRESTIRAITPAGRGGPTRVAQATPSEALEPDQDLSKQLARINTGTLSAPEHMLGCILCDGAFFAGLSETDRALIAPDAYSSSLVASVSTLVLSLGTGGSPPSLSALLQATEAGEVQSGAVCLMSRVAAETDRDDARLAQHWRACLERARTDRAHEQLMKGQAANPAAKLAQLREIKLKTGADRRAMPRPRGQ